MKLRTAIKTICGVGSLALMGTSFIGLASASASGAGLHLVSVSSVVDSAQAKSATVSCPAGEYVVGTGADISVSKPGTVGLVSVTPLPGLTAVTAVAAENGKGTTQNWTVRAYATCVQPAFGIALVSAITAPDSQNKVVTANCAPGWNVVGTGGQVSTPDAGKVFLHAIITSSNLTSVTAEASENGKGTLQNWTVKAYAICVPAGAVSGLQMVSTGSLVNSNHAKSIVTYCPAGKRVLGATAEISTPQPNHMIIEDITPLPNLSGVNTVASEGAGQVADLWIVTSHAICAAL